MHLWLYSERNYLTILQFFRMRNLSSFLDFSSDMGLSGIWELVSDITVLYEKKCKTELKDDETPNFSIKLNSKEYVYIQTNS